jgi:hypothetical protein
MNTYCNFTIDEILYLDPEILAEALTLFQNLIAWADNDIFSEAPERAERVTGAEATLQLSHQVMGKIEKTIQDGDLVRLRRANCILDEAEEAFGARSLAEERAACGGWSLPETVADYLFWVADEAALQEELGEDLVYARALRGVADEIRALGFEASPEPWEKVIFEAL